MAACTNVTYIVRMFKIDDPAGSAPSELDQLTFNIRLGAGGVIDPAQSTVFLSDQFLSQLSGTCQPLDNGVTNPVGTALTLFFTWDTVDIFMTAFTFKKGFKRFRGSWFAKTHVGALEKQLDAELTALLAPPSDGDTGTGTGQQT